MALARLPSDTFFREAFREADDFFSHFLPTPGGVMVPLAGPPVSGEARAVNRIIPVDVTETDDAYQLKADLPGVKKEDVSLDVDGNIIRIGAKRGETETKEEESPDRRWHRSERRSYAAFQQRALRMPENTDLSKLIASYDDGTLTIDVKKVPEKVPEVKQIPIA